MKNITINVAVIARLAKQAVAISLLILSLSAFAYAATYYVDKNHPDASNANPGSEPLPWLTIQYAADIITAGDTVIVKSGRYDERVYMPRGLTGAPDAKITFKSEPRRSVNMWGFQNFYTNYLRMEGFNMKSPLGGWDKRKTVFMRSVEGCEIVDNYIYDVRDVAVTTSRNAYVGYNKIYKVCKGIVASDNSTVEFNEIERLYGWDMEQDNDYTRFFGSNIIFRNNYMHGTDRSELWQGAHVDFFQTFDTSRGSQHIIIENNICIGPVSQGMMFNGEKQHDSYDFTIRNNVFAKISAWGMCAHEIRDVKIYNNVFSEINTHGIGLRTGSTGIVKNNIFYNIYGNSKKYYGGIIEAENNIVYEEGKPYDPADYPNDLVNVDPLFMDTAINNFRLQASSPGIDTGINLGATGFDYDITGTLRPQGLSWDIGCYEYTGDSGFLLGDVDGNGSVEINDAGICVRIALGLKIPTLREELAADYDQNGTVEIPDAAAIVLKALGLS